MDKQIFLLRNARILDNLKATLDTLPLNDEFPIQITIADSSRTLPQNDKFHALCGDVSKQGIVWAGNKWGLQDWKCIFVSGHAKATGKEGQVIEGLEGELVPLARESTAKMSIKRMGSLIEYSQAWAVYQGVKLTESRYAMNYYGHRI
ncbi:recombination protein NinB [Xenorhabdus szentirmaii]|uniref:Recombination protein NinB n=1 Tax=Xenorhabdus szentirmaii TaxID=290112 RepID=A0AAW3Z3M3_9GAMM|nr:MULTISPECIES: recombination protein NinB [Xenorhabdus]MBD2791742.1 recombination protein NinB [Xenorhabdus sp. CUL]MBD2803043.1 recombination protein NinB [Xenorhabdus sp. M]MBD2804101.1 recombination protein NinB [Xenorhabdus sp. ZM]MBD2826993.1 recombination protein NinB [Xenorhabdus sp. 5]PHM42367.1 NinB protein [Xenorhabdus szentirmaii]